MAYWYPMPWDLRPSSMVSDVTTTSGYGHLASVRKVCTL
jgi:hypothetical protein